MTYLFTCNEPDVTKVRMVTEVEKIPANILPLYYRIAAWHGHHGPEIIGQFYDEAKRFYLVDNVGLLWSTNRGDTGLEGHFVFWDGRLRGREGLVRGMATVAMDLAGKNRLWVIVPREKTMILKFLWRVGFTMEYEYRGLCKVYINHPSRRD